MNKVIVFGVTENPGGVESFLLNYYRNIDRTKLQFDFLCNTKEVAYEEEIKALGGRIYRIPARRDGRRAFHQALDSFFKKHAEEYCAIWVNVCSLANIDYLKAARNYGISVRVIHCHNGANGDNWLRGMVHRINRLKISNLATDYWSCSEAASSWFYSRSLRNCSKYRVIRNAVDVDLFQRNEEWRRCWREKFGVEKKLVIGHIGRFHFQKNHEFLLKIFAEIEKLCPESVLVLVGQGELYEQIWNKVQKQKWKDKVIFTGVRDDIAQLYSMMDVFLMPSLFEGLPMVGIEAQAAGLPCLFSDAITQEVVITSNARRMSLKKTPKEWAEAAVEMAERGNIDAGNEIRQKGYDIKTEAKKLQNFFTKCGRKKYIVAEKGMFECHAGSKARRDIAAFLTEEGWEPVYVTKGQGRGIWHRLLMGFVLPADWIRVFLTCQRESIVMIQFPLAMYPKVSGLAVPFIRALKKKAKIVFLVHDLDSLREDNSRTTEKKNEKAFLSLADAVICHNNEMVRYISEKKLTKAPMKSLRIFDYFTEKPADKECAYHTVAIAGNMDPKKAGYVYKLGEIKNIRWRIFGPAFEKERQAENMEYLGTASPEELPARLEAAFGLVWDGPDTETCKGNFGRYLKYNNPHKTSLYLAAGIPVIIWKDAAMAGFIKENNLGFCVGSLKEIPDRLDGLSKEEYELYRANAKKMSESLRNGHYTKEAAKWAAEL